MDGRILFTGGQVEGPAVNIGPCLLDIAHGQVGVTFLPGLREAGSRNQSASVLLPPVQDQKAMLLGGGTGEEGIDATAAVDVIDLTANMPTFLAAAGQRPPHEEMRLDVYSPPYLFKGPGPEITAAPEEWHYGQALDIASPQAGGIQWAHLRNGVPTHSFNNAQRLVDLPITAQGGDTVRVTVTDAPNIAPWRCPCSATGGAWTSP